MKAFLLLGLALAAPLRAAERPVELTATDELGEGAYKPSFSVLDESLELKPSFKAGVMALTESFPYPYPILKRSPYASAGLGLTYHGVVDSHVSGSLSVVDLRSELYSQVQGVASWYGDVGKTFSLGESWKGAFYAAFDQFTLGPLSGGTGSSDDDLQEGSLGTSWLYRGGPHELSLAASLGGEFAPKNAYRNTGGDEIALFGRGAVEYLYNSPAFHWLVGAEGRETRADGSIRPYIGIGNADTSLLLATEVRRSKNAFYPDAKAVAATTSARVTKDLTLGFSGRYETRSYAMAPEPVNEMRLGTELTWTPGASAIVRSAKSWGIRSAEEYSAEKQNAFNASVPEKRRETVRRIIGGAPTLEDFYRFYKPVNSMEILAAVSEMTAMFSKYNYNYNEGKPENLDKVGDIYARTRGTYIAERKNPDDPPPQDPTLVCLGAAQYAAVFAEELGRRSGVPIQASAMTVKAVLDGRADGHAATQIKTKEYGIVWADWGGLIPTYTWDTERALRVYQSVKGVPALYHQITDAGRDGRHVGYLFTEEGRLYLNSLTVHGDLPKSRTSDLFRDPPRGDAAAAQRWKDLLRK